MRLKYLSKARECHTLPTSTASTGLQHLSVGACVHVVWFRAASHHVWPPPRANVFRASHVFSFSGMRDYNQYYDYADHCSNICFLAEFSPNEKPDSRPYPRPALLDEWLGSGPDDLKQLFDDNDSSCVTVLNAINGAEAVRDAKAKVNIVKMRTENQETVLMKIVKQDNGTTCDTANVLFEKRQSAAGCEYLEKCELIAENGNECQVQCACPTHYCQLDLMLLDAASISLCEIEKIIP